MLFFLNNNVQAINANDVPNWGEVIGLKIAILSRSEIQSGAKPNLTKFKLLDANISQYNDSNIRQVFQTAITINNKVL